MSQYFLASLIFAVKLECLFLTSHASIVYLRVRLDRTAYLSGAGIALMRFLVVNTNIILGQKGPPGV